jgi:hypothetical protein
MHVYTSLLQKTIQTPIIAAQNKENGKPPKNGNNFLHRNLKKRHTKLEISFSNLALRMSKSLIQPC